MGAIVEIQLGRLARLLEDRKITLNMSLSARSWLAEKGYDPAYGARPLKRVIQKNVQDPLAELILSGRDFGRLGGHDRGGPQRVDFRRSGQAENDLVRRQRRAEAAVRELSDLA